MAKHKSGELRCPATALILHNFCKSIHLFMTIFTLFAVIESKTFAVKDVERRGALGSKFHVICKCRDTVGTEYNHTLRFPLRYTANLSVQSQFRCLTFRF